MKTRSTLYALIAFTAFVIFGGYLTNDMRNALQYGDTDNFLSYMISLVYMGFVIISSLLVLIVSTNEQKKGNDRIVVEGKEGT